MTQKREEIAGRYDRPIGKVRYLVERQIGPRPARQYKVTALVPSEAEVTGWKFSSCWEWSYSETLEWIKQQDLVRIA